jgi:uncharacterized protein (UPF0210 family)
MLTQREIISTLEMLRNENLDVRTVTLGMNLLDCAGSDLSHVRRRIAERVMRLAGQLVPVCDRVGQKYGIPVVNKRIAVSPIAVVAAALSPAELVELARDQETELRHFIGSGPSARADLVTEVRSAAARAERRHRVRVEVVVVDEPVPEPESVDGTPIWLIVRLSTVSGFEFG